MEEKRIKIDEGEFPLLKTEVLVVGSGAAALNAAIQCKRFGIDDVLLVTEKLGAGTSANAGSDKQTYYRVNPAGQGGDSALHMAEEYFKGGSVHGDIAFVEAALSSQAFYNLVNLGVPFPQTKYGDFVGFKTDHDPKQRGTSAGPKTSIQMYQKLLLEAKYLGVRILENLQIIEISTENRNNKKSVTGAVAINRNDVNENSYGLTALECSFLILGTGGPGLLYRDSVYPYGQSGSFGFALKAGAVFQNLALSQFGIASTKFRWNLSGTYQQVLPRYFSCNSDGSDEQDFLSQFFPDFETMMMAQFLKGYQWPFDVRKVNDFGSSSIDILVYYETKIRNRKVYLDFRSNPTYKKKKFSFDQVPQVAKEYLEKSEAHGQTPVERLKQMNMPSYELYLEHGIDLEKEPLEIAVANQHLNGGIKGTIWWESSVKNMFPIGECNGSHGVYRPGGSALNAGQVGGIRAAQMIRHRMNSLNDSQMVSREISLKKNLAERFNAITAMMERPLKVNPLEERKKIQARMSHGMGIIKNKEQINDSLKKNNQDLKDHENYGITKADHIFNYIRNEDLLLTESAFIQNVLCFLEKTEGSRGSNLVADLSEILTIENDGACSGIQAVAIDHSQDENIIETSMNSDGTFISKVVKVRPVPTDETWFEKVWKEYMDGAIYKEDNC